LDPKAGYLYKEKTLDAEVDEANMNKSGAKENESK
jgi:hypothetical protein